MHAKEFAALEGVERRTDGTAGFFLGQSIRRGCWAMAESIRERARVSLMICHDSSFQIDERRGYE